MKITPTFYGSCGKRQSHKKIDHLSKLNPLFLFLINLNSTIHVVKHYNTALLRTKERLPKISELTVAVTIRQYTNSF